MNNHFYPCLWINNQLEEISNFYQKIFAAQLKESNSLVHLLSLKGQHLMLLNGGPMFQPNASISFLIPSEDENETRRLYDALIEDGIALMPLQAYPFSSLYGWVRDKFGITWQLYTGDAGNTDQYFTPTLMFLHHNNGKAKEAIQFYTSLFPNSSVEGILEYPEGNTEDIAGHVQHAQFHLNGYTMACMDSSINHPFDFTEGISLVKCCNDQDEIDYYWNKLTADGGEESMCGWLKDKYGVSWQIIPENIRSLVFECANPKSANEALMKMRKLDIATLKAAGAQ